MKKRIVTIGVCCLLLLSLVGCGSVKLESFDMTLKELYDGVQSEMNASEYPLVIPEFEKQDSQTIKDVTYTSYISNVTDTLQLIVVTSSINRESIYIRYNFETVTDDEFVDRTGEYRALIQSVISTIDPQGDMQEMYNLLNSQQNTSEKYLDLDTDYHGYHYYESSDYETYILINVSGIYENN
ncbi:MAG: hypothetical protein ACC608_05855 [Anaerofustis sp.]